MKERKILTHYLLPTMLQIILISGVAAVLKQGGVETGYATAIGIALIVAAGVSSALWGTVYQCRCNGKHITEVIKDFFQVRQSVKVYLLAVLFLLIDFGGVILSGGFQAESLWFPILLFLKALVFGGIEEIGWRYSFQPALEGRLTYIGATFVTFACWGIWHFLFFYIDGSLLVVDLPFFLLGLLTNCFILSALYAYSGSLWICVMTHAMINVLSQIAAEETVIVSMIGKVVCVVIAVGVYRRSVKNLGCNRIET